MVIPLSNRKGTKKMQEGHFTSFIQWFSSVSYLLSIVTAILSSLLVLHYLNLSQYFTILTPSLLSLFIPFGLYCLYRYINTVIHGYRQRQRLYIIDSSGHCSPVPGPSINLLAKLLVGHMPMFVSIDNIPTVQRKLAQSHGPVVMTLDVFGHPIIHPFDPTLLQAIHSSRAYHFSQKEVVQLNLWRVIGYRCLLSLDGDDHRLHRRILNPLFTPNLIKKFLPLMSISFDELESLIDQSIGEDIEFQRLSSAVTLNVISRFCTGEELNALYDDESTFISASHILTYTFKISVWHYVCDILPSLRELPVPSNIRFKQARKFVGDHIKSLVQTHLQQLSTKESSPDSTSLSMTSDNLRGILLSTLVKQCINESQLTEQDVYDEIMTLLLAGHETTSVLFSMIAYFLAKYPEVQNKLVEELRNHQITTMNTTTSEIMDNYELLTKCEYLTWIIHETLRLHSPVYMLTRRVLIDTELPMSDGRKLHIPKNTSLFIPLQAIHLDPNVWGPDYEQFRPERWATCEISTNPTIKSGTIHNGKRIIQSYSYMPFLGGARACIGKQFAMMEIRLLITRLVLRYQISIPKGSPLETMNSPPMTYSTAAKPNHMTLLFNKRS